MNPNPDDEYKPETSTQTEAGSPDSVVNSDVPNSSTQLVEPDSATDGSSDSADFQKAEGSTSPTNGSANVFAGSSSDAIVNEQRAPGDIPTPLVGQPLSGVTPTPPTPRKSRKKLVIGIIVALAALLVLGGGLAFAYFQVIVPNKPENILKASLYNTIESKHLTLAGEMDFETDDGPAIRGEFTTQTDVENTASTASVELTISGIDFTFDIRSLDDELYIRVGDLSTIKALITASLSGYLGGGQEEIAMLSALIEEADRLLSGQWILFDETLLETAGVNCLTDTSIRLTEEDRKILEEQFEKNPFVVIDSHADESVDGVASIKYELTIDNKKGNEYAKGLDELSIFKSAKGCESIEESIDTEIQSDDLLLDGTTKLTVWVDKDAKRINKFALSDLVLEEETNTTTTISANVNYDSFAIEKPEDAKPAMQIVSELQTLLFSSGLGLDDTF